MPKKEVWDFECPQYVDFQRELDRSGKDDIFFDSKDKSPGNGSLSTPDVQVKGKGLTESDENRLLGKMTAALSLLENTPKIKKSASRGKLFPESVYKGMTSKSTKSTVKPNTVPTLHPKSRRSKSLDHINKITSYKMNKGKKYGLRKSSSLNDLKTNNKMMKYPVTPMCLKRTIFKAKEKIIKTTEEMELEQIAKLQKQLIQHLRQNEISLKKLNLRPRQCAVSKTVPKSDNLKDVKGTLIEKSNAAEKGTRRNIQTSSQAALKKDASELDTESNDNISSKKTDNTIYSRKSKALPVSSLDVNNHAIVKKEPSKSHNTIINRTTPTKKTIYSKRAKTLSTANSLKLDNTVISEDTMSKKTSYSRRTKTISIADSSKLDSTIINETAASKRTIYSRRAKTLSTVDSDVYKDTVQKTKKLVHKRILDHSGLMFIPSVKNNISVKSFIFEEKIQDKPHIVGAKQKETSALCVKENGDKENNSCIGPQFTSKKIQATQNIKCDTNKVAESNRITGKRITNHLRGVPLAENVARD